MYKFYFGKQCVCVCVHRLKGLPGDTVVKNPPANSGDPVLITESGSSLGVGNGNPLHYSCLENSMDRGS